MCHRLGVPRFVDARSGLAQALRYLVEAAPCSLIVAASGIVVPLESVLSVVFSLGVLLLAR